MFDLYYQLLKFCFQSLLVFKDEYEEGEVIFRELFHDRSITQSQLKTAYQLKDNVTIIGNPGEGKTCFMHYMLTEIKNNKRIFPITLDYRACVPKKTETLLLQFVEQMRRYFKEISKDININEATTNENMDNHFRLILKHLQGIQVEYINNTKRAVLLLDDFDYMNKDDEYIQILKTYFAPFAFSRKVTIVLCGRKPLVNNICKDDELRQAFKFRPKPIHLARLDLKQLISFRLSKLGETRLKRIAKKTVLKTLGAKDSPEAWMIQLGFNDLVYNLISDITGRNLRLIEDMLPDLFAFQYHNKNKLINLNAGFFDAYIECCGLQEDQLLDVVSEKTESKTKKKHGNSVLQIVLEYFRENQLANSHFFETMDMFGIDGAVARRALNRLTYHPYALLDPEDIYNTNTVYEKYTINGKGRLYLDHMLGLESYYAKLSQRQGFPVSRTDRRFLSR